MAHDNIEADVDVDGRGPLPARPCPAPPHWEKPASARPLVVALEHGAHGIVVFQLEHLL